MPNVKQYINQNLTLKLIYISLLVIKYRYEYMNGKNLFK